jgi:hypothetical protein
MNDDVLRGTALVANLVAYWEGYQAHKKTAEQPEPIVNLKALQKRVNELKSDPIVKELGKKFEHNPDMPAAIKELQEKAVGSGYKKSSSSLYASVQLSATLKKEYDKRLEAKAKEAEPKKLPTISQGYHAADSKALVDKVLAHQGNYMVAANATALMLALREAEKAGGGLDAPLNTDAVVKRTEELAKDPAVIRLGQNLTGPNGSKEMDRYMQMKPDPIYAFAEMVDEKYQKAIQEQQKNQNGKQKDAQPEQNVEQPGEKEPDGPEVQPVV